MQDSVSSFPDQAYAGKVHVSGQFPTTNITRLAYEDIPFGRAVAAQSSTGLTAGNQTCFLPTADADANAPLLLGVAMADASMEDVNGAATYVGDGAGGNGGDAVSIMKSGQIWVEVESAVADLTDAVCIGVGAATGGHGSFDNTAAASLYIACTGMKWVAYALVGSTHLGLVQVDL